MNKVVGGNRRKSGGKISIRSSGAMKSVKKRGDPKNTQNSKGGKGSGGS